VVSSVTSSSSFLCFFPRESFSAICYFLASNALVIPEILRLVNWISLDNLDSTVGRLYLISSPSFP